MDFAEYAAEARSTRLLEDYSRIDHPNLPYLVIGLTEEAGEVAGEIKKLIRDGGGVLTPERADRIVLELSDVLWYLSQISEEIGCPLEEIARRGVEKIHARWDGRIAREKHEKKPQGE